MKIQPELLELLRNLPVCVGLGVKGDVHEVEQFYSEVCGVNLEMAGFIDLSVLAVLAGYQMNARGMTPMGVQVLGAILNNALRICMCGEDLNLNPRYELNGQGRLACNLNLIFSVLIFIDCLYL